jgi:hypothetical protein
MLSGLAGEAAVSVVCVRACARACVCVFVFVDITG